MYTLKGLFLFSFLFTLLVLFSSPPPLQATARLTFSKQLIMPQKDKFYRHKVQKGQWVSSILLLYGFDKTDLPVLLPKVKAINPQIRDLDKISPGQTINIPRQQPSLKKSQNLSQPDVQQPEAQIGAQNKRQISHVVRPGEHVAKILRAKTNLPEDLIFDEYLNKFKELNPEIQDINNLKVGQRINVPLPPGQKISESSNQDVATTLKGQKTNKLSSSAKPANSRPQLPPKSRSGRKTKKSQPPQATNAQIVKDLAAKKKIVPKKEIKLSAKNKLLCRSMLSQIGFDFTPGQELIYPLPSGRWLHLNLQKTPLVRSSWGDLLLFVPERVKPQISQNQLAQAGFKLCFIADNWHLQEILQKIEEIKKSNLTLWSKRRSLILNPENNTLELQADYILITKTDSQRKIFLFNLNSPLDMDAPNLLQAFLEQKGVYLFFQNDSRSGNAFKQPTWPKAEDLYIPRLNSEQAWPELRRLLGKKAVGISPSSSRFQDIYPLLKNLELLEDEYIVLSWFANSNRKITLRVPVLSLKTNSKKVLIFPQTTSPYLLQLFILKGYQCLLLS